MAKELKKKETKTIKYNMGKSPYKMKGSPMARNFGIGASAAKRKSEKIGPAISDEMMANLRKKRDDAEMNLDVSSDTAYAEGRKVQKEIDEQRKYIKKQGNTLKPSQ